MMLLNRISCISVTLIVLAGMTAAIAQETAPKRRAMIAPSVVYLQPGEEAAFTVTLTPGHDVAARVVDSVRWSVNDMSGGTPALGTINAQGLYCAPDTLPSRREIHICAEAPEAANRFLWATVILGDAPPAYTSRTIWSEPITEADGGSKHLGFPHGIGVDQEGNILITDQKRSTALRYSPEGNFLGELFKGKNYMRGPRIILMDPAGRIVVSDDKPEGNCIQIFSIEEKLLHGFAPKGSGSGEVIRVHGIDFDPEGNLYAICVDNARVSIFNPEGQLLNDWGMKGLLPGQLNLPHGLAVDKNGDVFVMNFHGPAQKFTSQGDYLGAFCYAAPPDGTMYFHNMHGDRWGNVYIMARADGVPKNPPMGEAAQEMHILKFNNNGDFITSIPFSREVFFDTSAVIDAEGRVYALFVNDKEIGVEIFEEG